MNHVALPHDFYDSNCWRINIIKHYVNNKYSYKILEYPVQALTVSLETIIKVYGNYPEDVMVLLSQTTNPLFTSDEYKDNIYKVIKNDAILNKNPYIDAVAESLYYIRLLFEKNNAYLAEHFTTEILQLRGTTIDEKIQQFADELSMIVKTHTGQVRNMIKEYCG
jgi:hypothetical protein